MEDRQEFNPDELLDRAVDAVLRHPIPDELPPDRVAQLAAVVQHRASRPGCAYPHNPYASGGFLEGEKMRLGLSRWGATTTGRLIPIVALSLALALAGAASVLKTFRPVYEASAWLQVLTPAPHIVERPRDVSRRFVQNQIELIRSPLVLGPVIGDLQKGEFSGKPIKDFDEFKKQKAPIEWLRKKITVRPVGQSEYLQVSFEGPDPRRSADILNAVVDRYFDLRGAQDAEQTQRLIDLLKRELERRTQEAERLREKYRVLAKEATGKDPFAGGTQAEAALTPHPLQQLQGHITTAQVEQAILEARIGALEASMAEQQLIVTDAEVSRAIAQHPEVVALRAEISLKEARLRQYKVKVVDGEEDPRYQSLLEEIELDKARLGNMTEQLKEPVKAQLEAGLANTRKSELHELQLRLKGYQVMEKVLQEKFDSEVKRAFPGGMEAGAVLTPHPLQQLQRQITTAQVEQRILEARIKALEESIAKQQVIVTDAEVSRAVAQHPEVVALRAEISFKEARLGEYKTKLVRGEEDPLYQSLLKEIEFDKARLDNMIDQLQEPVKAQLEAALANARKSELHELQRRLKDCQVMEKVFQEKYDSELETAVAFTGETLDVELARGAYERAEAVVQRIDERIMMLEIERGAPARVLLMQRAEPPTRPTQLLPYKSLLLASLTGLLLPWVVLVPRWAFTRRVSSASQLAKRCQTPIVGAIAALPYRHMALRPPQGERRVPESLRVFQESADALRTGLALSKSLKHVKVVAVTSATNNEGKTSVAIQLAMSCARASGETVLLIDGHMRSPDVHKVLECPRAPGLAEVLDGKCTLEDAIITNWSQRVHILPAGRARRSPDELLGNGPFKSLLETVRSSYRYVLIDAPPILTAPESLVLAQAVDASLLCCLRGVSRWDWIKASEDLLEEVDAEVAGIVLSGVPPHPALLSAQGSYDYVAPGSDEAAAGAPPEAPS